MVLLKQTYIEEMFLQWVENNIKNIKLGCSFIGGVAQIQQCRH